MTTADDITPVGDTSAADASGDGRMARVTARAGYMMGENAARAWSPDHAPAWEGFLELSRQLRRAADGVLEPVEGLTVSTLGIMGRLARAERLTLRQTDVAEAMGLSVSRVSRLVDTLEARRLVERRPCPTDARAVNVVLTPAGSALTRRAQDAVFAFVEQHFFAPLDEAEIATLAGVFTRLVERWHAPADGDCD
jgi:DNA-binding MarR family transcriptional regulator